MAGEERYFGRKCPCGFRGNCWLNDTCFRDGRKLLCISCAWHVDNQSRIKFLPSPPASQREFVNSWNPHRWPRSPQFSRALQYRNILHYHRAAAPRMDNWPFIHERV